MRFDLKHGFLKHGFLFPPEEKPCFELSLDVEALEEHRSEGGTRLPGSSASGR